MLLKSLCIALVIAIAHHDPAADCLVEPVLLQLCGILALCGLVKDQLRLKTVTAPGKGTGTGIITDSSHLQAALPRIGQISRKGHYLTADICIFQLLLYVPDSPQGIRLPGQVLILAEFLQMPPYCQGINLPDPIFICINIQLPTLLT